METIIVQITNNKALKLLQELEELNLIKLLKNKTDTSQKLSEKYAGKLSDATVDKLQQHLKQSRDEWI
ncbi:MAG: hypothetical protein M3Y85_05675 [Bacteroidota bacterium]|nr:hypothetical protein [Bacteroidota bacterium]